MDYMVETRHLSKVIKENNILNDVSIHIPKGSIYCLAGNNGAGKSTLMKILCGVESLTHGKLLLDGAPWTRDQLEMIGSLIENPAIYENLTASENLKIICQLKSIDFKNIDLVLQKVGLHNINHKKCKDFSLGMKERLGIAMALLGNPSLLVLDEPTNGLDPQGIKELRTLLLDLKEKGITILISTHMLSEINHLADYVGVLEGGNLIFEDKYNSDVLNKLLGV